MRHIQNELPEIGILDLRRLNEVVLKNYDTDLGIYAHTSLKRKISRFIADNSLKDVDNLIFTLKNDSSIFFRLMQSISVSCTEFFRDPSFWRILRDEIFPILNHAYQELCFWIPGCSTGEEVLSLAITLHEAGLYEKSKILTSDTNEELLTKSKDALYCSTKIDISEYNYKRFRADDINNLSDYVIYENGNYKFRKFLYENLQYGIFKGNDLEKKSSFLHGYPRIHMILCRNYFIYFTSTHQENLLHVFTNKLIPGGYLAIGNKENISFCENAGMYLIASESERIYRKK